MWCDTVRNRRVYTALQSNQKSLVSLLVFSDNSRPRHNQSVSDCDAVLGLHRSLERTRRETPFDAKLPLMRFEHLAADRALSPDREGDPVPHRSRGEPRAQGQTARDLSCILRVIC